MMSKFSCRGKKELGDTDLKTLFKNVICDREDERSIVTSVMARCHTNTIEKKTSKSFEGSGTPFLPEVWARAGCGRLGGVCKRWRSKEENRANE